VVNSNFALLKLPPYAPGGVLGNISGLILKLLGYSIFVITTARTLYLCSSKVNAFFFTNSFD
jgi:hypothetical protein